MFVGPARLQYYVCGVVTEQWHNRPHIVYRARETVEQCLMSTSCETSGLSCPVVPLTPDIDVALSEHSL